MVEPTIWPAWEGEKAEQGEECKTSQTYGRTNHLARLGGQRRRKQGEDCRQDGPMVEPTIWPLGGQRRRSAGRRLQDKTDLW
ncbi:hypothetical protein DPMN_131603 [Dreissena polymorpha]|uniref:Uncharacterized protein n=1 Tax=Dreissena polymorpha TaxID=45954 RepID=A0A9D4J9B3_DREPO|nr:hypothetical protein DPMN_131603 [Dreissena polymorpha]